MSSTDIDDNLNGRVRYSINSGDANRDFTIAEDTGVVRVAKNLNYERKSRYELIVRAEDCAGDINGAAVRSDSAKISIAVSDINDNPPTFLDSPYLAFVMENIIPPNGGYVITVQAYDADTPPFNNLVKYFIKEGDTDIFRINASTGDISLLRALDREIQNEYVLSLVAMDTGKFIILLNIKLCSYMHDFMLPWLRIIKLYARFICITDFRSPVSFDLCPPTPSRSSYPEFFSSV